MVEAREHTDDVLGRGDCGVDELPSASSVSLAMSNVIGATGVDADAIAEAERDCEDMSSMVTLSMKKAFFSTVMWRMIPNAASSSRKRLRVEVVSLC